ncbi:MAG TPA: hypothetical protein VGC36_14755 [Rhizomicrobium sp.]
MKALALAAAMAALAQPALAGACVENGAPLTGRFEWASLTAPNGKPIPAPFVVLDTSICTVSGAQGRRVTLELKDDAALNGLAAGAVLTVTGDYAAPDAQWNSADIVATNAVIVSRP